MVVESNKFQKSGKNFTFSLQNTDSLRFPVLISVPHAGREYPPEISENLRVPASYLLKLEDRYSDLLANSATAAGFPVIMARKSRAWIDINRDRNELDPDMITGMDQSCLPQMSRKVRGGLGIIPRRLNGIGNLWREKWQYTHIMSRIAEDHEPYHTCVDDILSAMRSRFGGAILLDLHSMPPLLDTQQEPVNFVIGDRFGQSSDSLFAELVAARLRSSGLSGQTNHPYPGGYVLDRHGQPEHHIHALQIEIDRSLYLDNSLREPTKAVESISKMISDVALRLSNHLNDRGSMEAAE